MDVFLASARNLGEDGLRLQTPNPPRPPGTPPPPPHDPTRPPPLRDPPQPIPVPPPVEPPPPIQV
jgi:hypothetical protein